MAVRTLYGFDEDGNKIAVGSYNITTITVTLLKSGSGATAGGSVHGAGNYSVNDSVTITAFDGPQSIFSAWQDSNGNIVSISNPYTFTATEDVTYTATFFYKPNTGSGGSND